MRGQIERRRGRQQYTIDQPFDGNEGWIAWYCQYINGKIYPLIGKMGTIPTPYSTTIRQIELLNKYLFILFENDALFIFDTDNLSVINVRSGVQKIGIIEVGNSPHLVYLSHRALWSSPPPFMHFRWWIPLDNILDFSIYQNRVFILRNEGEKRVIYFSRNFISNIPGTFFYEQDPSRDDFFTFTPNFFLTSQSDRYILFKNFLITNRAVYVITPKEYGGVLQFYPALSFNLPDILDNFVVQGNKNGIFFSNGNKTWDANGKEYNFSVKKFLSNEAFPVIQNNFYSSIIDENSRIDFHNEDFLVKIGNNLVEFFPQRYSSPSSTLRVLKINENENEVLDGKLILFTSFNDEFHHKYLKKISIKDYKDIYKIPSNPSFISVAPFPYGLTDSLTEEEIMQEKEEWIQTRGAGVKFQIEFSIRGGGLYPVVEAEYDWGK
jgi:hypothetical protein